jgi:hypothetical protein
MAPEVKTAKNSKLPKKGEVPWGYQRPGRVPVPAANEERSHGYRSG